MSPKSTKTFAKRTGADPAGEARRCHDRLRRVGGSFARVTLLEEWEDWLAFAARERELRIDVFRFGLGGPPAEKVPWSGSNLRRAQG